MASSDQPSDIVGVGFACVDEILLVSRIPGPHAGAKVLRTSRQGGGSVPNTLVAAAKLGARARFVGALGDDGAGRFQIDELTRAGVDVERAIIRRGMASATCTILVDARNGARSFLSNRGESWKLDPSEIQPESLDGAKIVHLDSLDKWALEVSKMATAAGARVSVDPVMVPSGARPTAALEEFLPHVTYLIVEVEELGWVLPGMKARDAAAALESMGAGLVVVTLGSKGWIGRHQGKDLASRAIPAVILDTTGAGDAFRGAFLAGMLRNWDVDHSLRFATAAAAVCSTRLGARDGMPTEVEILSVMANARPNQVRAVR